MIDQVAATRVVQAAAGALGGAASLKRHESPEPPGALTVLTAKGTPEPGVSSYATIGFMSHDMGLRAEGASLRAELLMAAPDTADALPGLLVGIALRLARSGAVCRHGKIAADVVPRASPGELRHVLFSVPFLWDGPETVRFEDLLVAWLLLVPITEGEREFASRHGVEALEEVFRRQETDVFDLGRMTAVEL